MLHFGHALIVMFNHLFRSSSWLRKSQSKEMNLASSSVVADIVAAHVAVDAVVNVAVAAAENAAVAKT